jgi:hypothetical protein
MEGGERISGLLSFCLMKNQKRLAWANLSHLPLLKSVFIMILFSITDFFEHIGGIS